MRASSERRLVPCEKPPPPSLAVRAVALRGHMTDSGSISTTVSNWEKTRSRALAYGPMTTDGIKLWRLQNLGSCIEMTAG